MNKQKIIMITITLNGALGIIIKGTDKHINKIPSSPSQYEIQKIALCKNAISLG